jgi:hypothetical protein
VGRKLAFFNQEFSKRKRWVFGREVGMVTSRGMCSEGVPSLEGREVLGNLEQKAVLMKALSRRAKVGESLLLLKV